METTQQKRTWTIGELLKPHWRALALGFLLAFGIAAPATLAAVLCAIFLMTIVLAWWRHGQDTIPLRWLLFAPVYALSKVPLYGRFLVNRQRDWARGGR